MEKTTIGDKEYFVVDVNIKDNQQAIRDFSNLYIRNYTDGQEFDARKHDFVARIDMKDAYEATNGFVDPAAFKIFRYLARGLKANGQPITNEDLRKYGAVDGNVTLTQNQLIEIIYKDVNMTVEQVRQIVDKGASVNYYGFSGVSSSVSYGMGSVNVTFDQDKIRYQFKNGVPENILGFKPRIAFMKEDTTRNFVDNFDLESTSPAAVLFNSYLEEIIDSDKVGSKYMIVAKNAEEVPTKTLSIKRDILSKMSKPLSNLRASLYSPSDDMIYESPDKDVDARPGIGFSPVGAFSAGKDFHVALYNSNFREPLLRFYKKMADDVAHNVGMSILTGDISKLLDDSQDIVYSTSTKSVVFDKNKLNADAWRNGHLANTYNAAMSVAIP